MWKRIRIPINLLLMAWLFAVPVGAQECQLIPPVAGDRVRIGYQAVGSGQASEAVEGRLVERTDSAYRVTLPSDGTAQVPLDGAVFLQKRCPTVSAKAGAMLGGFGGAALGAFWGRMDNLNVLGGDLPPMNYTPWLLGGAAFGVGMGLAIHLSSETWMAVPMSPSAGPGPSGSMEIGVSIPVG